MKKLTFNLLIILFLTAGLTLTSCSSKNQDKTESTEQTADKTGKEYTSAYVCPMHCEGSGSEEAGNCPICKMEYVENTDHEGHDHDEHEGHDHDAHEGHDH